MAVDTPARPISAMSCGSPEMGAAAAGLAARSAGSSRARIAPRAIQRAAAASVSTPTDSAEAPTEAPGRSVETASARAAADMATSRTTVPPATSRVRPARMSTPCQNRR